MTLCGLCCNVIRSSRAMRYWRTTRADECDDERSAHLCGLGVGRSGENHAPGAVPGRDGSRHPVARDAPGDRAALSRFAPGPAADLARADAAHLLRPAVVRVLRSRARRARRVRLGRDHQREPVRTQRCLAFTQKRTCSSGWSTSSEVPASPGTGCGWSDSSADTSASCSSSSTWADVSRSRAHIRSVAALRRRAAPFPRAPS